MKRTQRSLASILSLAVLATVSLGTGSAIAANKVVKPVTIQFWNYWDGGNGKALSALISEFNKKNPGITVKPVTFPWGDLLPKLQTAIASGTTPALAATDIAWMANMNQSGKLVDLGAALGGIKKATGDIYPSLLTYGLYKGKLQSLPASTNNLSLFYNKDLFRKAGLNPNKPPKTWAEMRAAAIAISNLGNGIQGMEIYVQPGEGLTWQFQPYLWQSGAGFLNKTNTAPTFNSAAGRSALQFLVDLINVDRAATAGQWGAFDKGQAGMRIDGSWMVGGYRENAPFEFGTAMLPIPEGGVRATNMGGEQIMAFKGKAASQAAAVKFIRWFTSAPIQARWDVATNFMPISDTVANSTVILKHVASEPALKAFIDQQKYAQARPAIASYPAVSDAFSKALEPAFYGRVGVAEALANADAAVRKALKSN
ncbi:MAG: ABC transporter substrate-binding protein [Actinobacteria bacterium]|nr:ABC transporter substrate-binding protein [Actinomycetota bacterium]